MIMTIGRVCKTEDNKHVLLICREDGEDETYGGINMHTGEMLTGVVPVAPLTDNVAAYMAGIVKASLYHGGQLVLQKDESAAVAEALIARLKFEEAPLLLTALQKIQANADVMARRDFHNLQKTLEAAAEPTGDEA